MKKWVSAVLSLILVLSLVSSSCAIEFNTQDYTWEELITIREEVETRISEYEKAYAIENGNRIISFDNNEYTIFTKQSVSLSPEIKRVTEQAPEKTSLKWASSDDTIAKVDKTGKVTAVSLGDATITATASDDENIFSSITVHSVASVTGLTISEKEATLLLGATPESKSVSLVVTVTPSEAYNPTVIWSSSDEKVATVDSNGVVTAIAAGTATITAEPEDSTGKAKKVTCKINVNQAVEGISFDQTELSLDVKKAGKLSVVITPNDATNKKVIWSSSNEKVASVKDGKVTAKEVGHCTITATAADGSGIKANCEVTVINMISKVQFVEKDIVLLQDASTKIKPEVSPKNATNTTMSWTSSDSSIATVDKNGVVTPVKGGQCVISCTTTDGSNLTASYNVKISKYTLQGLLKSGTWYYAGSSKSLKQITFTDTEAIIQQATFDGNGKHINEAVSYPYTFGEGLIIVNTNKKMTIRYSLDGEKLVLGNNDYFTPNDVEKAIQGCWSAKSSVMGLGSQYEIEIKNGKLNAQHASEALGYAKGTYYYYGPFNGSYTLNLGGFNTSMNHGGEWFWTIVNGKVVLMHYTNVASPIKKLTHEDHFKW